VKRVQHIDREALEFIFKAARFNHPKEFAGVLRATGDVITEVLLLPGTLSSTESALLRLHMLPIDPSVCGTVHSHPSSGPLPSPDDFQFFDKFEAIHLIVAFPYTQSSWKAYNHRGEEIRLEVIG
jgi:proteasome lid subunit RPN8/RPN11